MSSPVPIEWWVTADCCTENPAALAECADRHPDAQYEGDSSNGGVVSVRYLSGSPTIEGVAINGRSAVMRTFGGWPTAVDVLALYRSADGAVYEGEGEPPVITRLATS